MMSIHLPFWDEFQEGWISKACRTINSLKRKTVSARFTEEPVGFNVTRNGRSVSRTLKL